jgi:hypothetical protein
VIDALEDTEDYRAFEAVIISDYDAGGAGDTSERRKISRIFFN